MRCGRSVAMVVLRPKHLSRTRSCICAVSISKVFAHGGGVCCKDQRPIMSRGICCLRSRLETVVADLLDGQYSNPVRVVGFNTAEGWSRDVSEDVAREVRRRCAE